MSENIITYYAVYGAPPPHFEGGILVDDDDLPDALLAVFIDEDEANEYDHRYFNSYVMPFDDFSQIPVWRRFQEGDEYRTWHNIRRPMKRTSAPA